MPIPDFQTLMLPLLRLMADRQEKSIREATEPLAQELQVTSEDLATLLLSGQSVFRNRISWAKTYLSKAGLLTPTRRGYFRITDRGIEVLGKAPGRIDIRFLEQFPEFGAFRQRTVQAEPEVASSEQRDEPEATPDEVLEQAYKRIRRNLAEDLLTAVQSAPSRFFENLVIRLLLAMGYGGSREEAGQVLGRAGDEGIDGLINEDKLGLDAIYVQAKRWEGTVGRPEIQKFVGAIHGKARKGIFITTGRFSNDARDYVAQLRDMKVAVVDGPRLADLMIEHNLGVTTESSFELKRLDKDFFGEE